MVEFFLTILAPLRPTVCGRENEGGGEGEQLDGW